jgi:3-oxoadipate CoA-transferase alpha subunit
MCTAANVSIVQAKSIVDPGQIDPEVVITPGIYVKKVIEINNPANESELVASEMKYPW